MGKERLENGRVEISRELFLANKVTEMSEPDYRGWIKYMENVGYFPIHSLIG